MTNENPIGPKMEGDRVVQRAVAETNLHLGKRSRQRRYRWPGDPEPQEGFGPFNRVGPDYKPRVRRSRYLTGE